MGQGDLQWAKETYTGPKRRAVGQGDLQWAKEMCSGQRFEVGGLILRVLDAFRPRGATWSGQVISSPRGPSGGPSKTHLLPGGGVPRVHRARSPVPPRLSLSRHSPVIAVQWAKETCSGPRRRPVGQGDVQWAK